MLNWEQHFRFRAVTTLTSTRPTVVFPLSSIYGTLYSFLCEFYLAILKRNLCTVDNIAEYSLLRQILTIFRPTTNAIMGLTFSNYVLQPFFEDCDVPVEAAQLLAAATICEFLSQFKKSDVY